MEIELDELHNMVEDIDEKQMRNQLMKNVFLKVNKAVGKNSTLPKKLSTQKALLIQKKLMMLEIDQTKMNKFKSGKDLFKKTKYGLKNENSMLSGLSDQIRASMKHQNLKEITDPTKENKPEENF